MASWLEQAFGLGDEAEPEAPRRRVAPEVKEFVCVVRQPSGAPGDLGATVDCWYFVERGLVTLCDQQGKPLTKSADDHDSVSTVLAPGEEPRRVASRLRREAWQSERSRFDRPLYYRTFGVA
jgi:hypothetical protein